MDFRVGRVVEVNEHPDADRLFLLNIDVGEEEPVQSVAGVKGHYSAEELDDRFVVVLRNLEPATIRGEKSEAMLLAATGEDEVVIVQPDPDRDVEPGTTIE